MKLKDLQAVIFDFDYTLADSSEGAIDCINFALQEMKLDQVSAESVPAMVEAPNQRGLKLAIVSTKYRRRIHEVLERETMLHGFEVVIGGEDVQHHKPRRSLSQRVFGNSLML